MTGAPAAASGAGGGGDVWEVRFDPLESFAGGVGGPLSGGAGGLPPLLFCTAAGGLCRAAGGKARGGLEAEVLLQEACSINSFDTDGVGGDVMAVTDFEGLIFAART
jgi:hypothetical protein